MINISVGYNNTGQEFFDLVSKYKVNSYYFNPIRDINEYLDPRSFYKKIKDCNTFGIQGNLMFNWSDACSFLKKKGIEDFTRLYINQINLNVVSATVMNQKTIDIMKEIDPTLKFHISIKANIDNVDKLKDFNIKDIYCVNIPTNELFNLGLMKQIRDLGVKTKSIPNIGCISQCPYDNKHGNCQLQCYLDENTSRQVYKKQDFSKFNGLVDIIKLSTRNMKNKELKDILEEWRNV